MAFYNKIEGVSAVSGMSAVSSTLQAKVYEVIGGVTYNTGVFDVNTIETDEKATTYRFELSNKLKRHQIARSHVNIETNSGFLFANRLDFDNTFYYQEQNFTDNIPAGVSFSQSVGIPHFKTGEISILPSASGNAFVVDRIKSMRNGHVLMLFRTSAYSVADGRYVQFRFRYNGEIDSYQLLTFQRSATNVRTMKLQNVFYGGLTTYATYTDASAGSQFNGAANHWLDLWFDESRVVVSTSSYTSGITPFEISGLSKIFDVYTDKYSDGIIEVDIPTGDSTSIMAFAYQTMEEPMIPADTLKYSLALSGDGSALDAGISTGYNTVGFTWSTQGFSARTTGVIIYSPIETGTSFSKLEIGYSTGTYDTNLRFNRRGGFAVDMTYLTFQANNVIGIGVSPYYCWVDMSGGASSGVIMYTGSTYYFRGSAGMIHNYVEPLTTHRLRMYVTSEGSIFWYLNGKAFDMVMGYSLANYLFPVEENSKRPVEIIFKGAANAINYWTAVQAITFYPDIRISDSNLTVGAGSQLSSISDELTGDGYILNYGYSKVDMIDITDVSNQHFVGVTYADSNRIVEGIEMAYNRNTQRLTVGSDPYNPRFTWLGYSKTDRIFLEPLAGVIAQSTLNVNQTPVDDAVLNRAEKQFENEVYTVTLKTIDPRIEIGDKLRLVSSRSDFDLNKGKEVIVLSYNKNLTSEDGSAAMQIEVGAITMGATLNNVINI